MRANATGPASDRMRRRARLFGALRNRSSRVRRPGAAGAAVAVISAALAVALTGCGGMQGPRAPCGNPLPSAQPSGWAGDPGAIASYVASGVIPPYYVATNDHVAFV